VPLADLSFALTDRECFGGWACVIARYEVLKFLRGRARDRFLRDESLVERIFAEAEAEDVVRLLRLSLLELCLEKPFADRRSPAYSGLGKGALEAGFSPGGFVLLAPRQFPTFPRRQHANGHRRMR
jgi:hypothetical protein